MLSIFSPECYLYFSRIMKQITLTRIGWLCDDNYCTNVTQTPTFLLAPGTFL